MLNEELKKAYTTQYMETNKMASYYMGYVFGKMQPFEEEWGKDASCFTTSEIMETYKSLFCSTIESLDIINGFLERYTRFMLSQNMVPDGQNHYEEIDNRLLHQCLDLGLMELKVVSRTDLIRNLEGLRNMADRFLPLAFFEGFNLTNFYTLTMDDFNGNKVKVKEANGSKRELEISDTLLKYAKGAAASYEYFTHDIVGNWRLGDTRAFRADDNRLIKDKNNTRLLSENDERYHSIMRQRIYSQLSRIKHSLDDSPYIGGKELKESGRIEMIKGFMNKDHLDPEAAIRAHRTEIEYRYGNIPNNSVSKFLLKYGHCFEE